MINDLLKNNGIATNDFQASHIATGLKLWECETDEERLERCRIYRLWRPLTEKKRGKLLQTDHAYLMAIAGYEPSDVEERQVEMELVNA